MLLKLFLQCLVCKKFLQNSKKKCFCKTFLLVNYAKVHKLYFNWYLTVLGACLHKYRGMSAHKYPFIHAHTHSCTQIFKHIHTFLLCKFSNIEDCEETWSMMCENSVRCKGLSPFRCIQGSGEREESDNTGRRLTLENHLRLIVGICDKHSQRVEVVGTRT